MITIWASSTTQTVGKPTQHAPLHLLVDAGVHRGMACNGSQPRLDNAKTLHAKPWRPVLVLLIRLLYLGLCLWPNDNGRLALYRLVSLALSSGHETPCAIRPVHSIVGDYS